MKSNFKDKVKLRLMLYNPWSLNNKIDAFMITLSDYSVDIAAVCETWLNDRNNPTTATIKSHGYSITHNFREGRKGGGTALIYKNCFALSPISFPNTFKSFELTAALAKRDAIKIILLSFTALAPSQQTSIRSLMYFWQMYLGGVIHSF